MISLFYAFENVRRIKSRCSGLDKRPFMPFPNGLNDSNRKTNAFFLSVILKDV